MVRGRFWFLREGGSGSGNFGHAGRPGEVGGSASGAQYMRKVALIHERAQNAPNDPATLSAYNAFKTQVGQQYENLVRSGVKFQFTDSDPYTNSKQMRADADKGLLKVYNRADDLPADHPLAQMSPYAGQTWNTIFRGVHDYYGHYVPGNQFGPKGELHAFQAHAKMFDDKALPALAAETLAQNAWVNFAPGHESLPLRDRPFAQQKAYAFPHEFASRIAHKTWPDALLSLKEAQYDPNDDSIPDEDYRKPRGRKVLEAFRFREGGIGSGNRGHAGRPGMRGGSAPSTPAGIATAKTLKDGGASVNLHGHSPTSGAIATLRAFERVVDSQPHGATLRRLIERYKRDNLAELQKPNRYIGTWFDKEDGKLYLDTGVHFQTRSEALDRAHAENQLAIYDINAANRGEDGVVWTMSDHKRPSESSGERIREAEAKHAEKLRRQWFHPDTPAQEIADKTLEAVQQ